MVKKVTTPRSTNKGPKKPKIERRNKDPRDTYLPPDIEQSSDKPPCSTTQPVYSTLIVDEQAERLRNQQFWLYMRDNENADMRHRIACSELLGKSLCMFPQKLEHTGKDGESLMFNVIIGDQKNG
jgi:hypothetical protein